MAAAAADSSAPHTGRRSREQRAVGAATEIAAPEKPPAAGTATPTARCSRDLLPVWGAALSGAVQAIARDLGAS